MMVSGAGSAPARSRMARSLALCTVKLPEICPEPPRIGSRITGAEITSLSSTMANGLPTFSCVTCGEFARAAGVEAERNDRLAGALVEAGLRVGEIAARHQHALLDQIGRLRLARAVQQIVLRRHAALHRLFRRRPVSTMRKSSLAVLPSNCLSRVGILQAGDLHQDAVGALALDQRLDGAEFVDAPLDDLDRLIDRLANALDDRRVGEREPDQPAGLGGDFEVALPGGAENAAERLRQRRAASSSA